MLSIERFTGIIFAPNRGRYSKSEYSKGSINTYQEKYFLDSSYHLNTCMFFIYFMGFLTENYQN